MLYDNGQLIGLYSEAYAAFKDDLYREIVFQTAAFVRREMTSPEGGFTRLWMLTVKEQKAGFTSGRTRSGGRQPPAFRYRKT